MSTHTINNNTTTGEGEGNEGEWADEDDGAADNEDGGLLLPSGEGVAGNGSGSPRKRRETGPAAGAAAKAGEDGTNNAFYSSLGGL